MKIHTNVESFKASSKQPMVLGLGNFDGLHLGHQTLLKKVIGKAQDVHGVSCVFTFREHPQSILHPESKPKLLTSLEHRMFLLERMGIDLCFLISFTREFAAIQPDYFIQHILKERFGVKTVVLGYNAHFGHDRKGDGALMQKLANSMHFEFEETSPVKAAGDFVSSSRIRKLIFEGNLKEASACLGRHFGILAKVISGDKRGRGMGFPTANLDIRDQVMPPEGVYPVLLRQVHLFPSVSGAEGRSPLDFKVESTGPWLRGALNYGTRPTFETGQHEPWTEIHIFDFKGDIYGEYLEVLFCPRLREEKKFSNAEELKAQITHDIEQARAILDASDFSKEELYKRN